MNKKTKGKAKVLNEAELKRVLKVASTSFHGKRNVALLYFSFGLGFRAKEMSNLKIGDVMSETGELYEEINLTITKGNKQRHAYLTNLKIRQALTEYLEDRKEKKQRFTPKDPLFLSQKGGAFSPNHLQILFKFMYKSAGINNASSHSGRRTFATNLIEKGVDIKAVSNLMGHTTIAMTAKYVEDNPVRLKKIAADALF